MDAHDAIWALTNLVEVCRSGTFYSDYDGSWELIGRADKALSLLTPMLLAETQPG